MFKDTIIEEVRQIRKEIEREHKNWGGLEKYFCKLQKRHVKNLFRGKPQKTSKEKVIYTL